MNDKIVPRAKWLFLTVYLLTICYYIYKFINPALYFHLHQPAFLTVWYFFKTYLVYPGGLAEYVSTFLEQLFYYPLAGSLIITFLGGMTILLNYIILNRIKPNKSNFYYSLVPFIACIILIHDYYFPISTIVKLIITLTAVWCFQLSFNNNLLKWINLIVLSILVYYLSGSAYFVIFILSVALLETDASILKKKYIFLLTVIIIGLIIPLVFFKFVFSISPQDKYFAFFPDMPVFMKYKPDTIFYILSFYIPAIFFLIKLSDFIKIILPDIWSKINQFFSGISAESIFKFKISGNKFASLINFSITILFISLVTYFSIKLIQDVHKKNIVAADYYSYTQEWDKVAGIAISDNTYNYYINFSYNRAIDNTGHFADLFFTYPQMLGADILFPDKVEAGEITFI
jgi:hypothetical protein